MAYNLQNIRHLLTTGFNIDDLRRFCFDDPAFKTVHHQLSPEMGQDKVIDHLLDHAERTLQLELLLTWAKEQNPSRYKQYEPYQTNFPVQALSLPGRPLSPKQSKQCHRIYLCHTSEDKPQVAELYHRLKAAGYHPWLDKYDLLPGQDWRREIEKIIRDPYNLTLVCLSNNSVTKQREVSEIEFVLGILDQMSPNTNRLIPVRLQECKIPIRLLNILGVNLFESDGFDRLKEALNYYFDQLQTNPELHINQYRRIDAAAPDNVEVGHEIDVLVQIRFPNSPPLGFEDKDWPIKKKPNLVKQTSDSVALKFPRDPETGELKSTYLEAQVVAPDFIVQGEARQRIEVPPDQESKVVPFLLTAKKPGTCRINIVLYGSNNTYLDTIPIETTVGGDTTIPTIQVANLILLVAIQSPELHYSLLPKAELPADFMVLSPMNNATENKKTDVYYKSINNSNNSKLLGCTISSIFVVLLSLLISYFVFGRGNPVTPTPTVAPVVLPTHTRTTDSLSQTIIAPDGASMVLVPTGPYEMGQDADVSLAECQKLDGNCRRSLFEDEEPAHTVTLVAFYIDQYEVTNAQYRQCVTAGNCEQTKCPDSYNDENKKDHPVVCVTWDQAQKYCEWRGGRLPTEAEWEKTARGYKDKRAYPWGEQITCEQANYRQPDSGGYCVGNTTPVGKYLAGVSPYDVYDMAGNVWEWVSDTYESKYYENSPQVNPTGPEDQENEGPKVIRGGGWRSSYLDVRVVDRYNHKIGDSDTDNDDLGFRCAADAP